MLNTFFEAQVHYKVAEDWMWETPVSAAEEALIARAVPKRQREFRAGRNAAHALFSDLQIHHPHLLRGQQREPAWPDGWLGSISHTDRMCLVALTSAAEASSIGLDVELATPLNPDLQNLICRPEEITQLHKLRDTVGAGYALEKLIFSAKESVHKTYFPLNYYTLDFLDARIDLDWDSQTFQAHILNPEPNPVVKISQLQGRFMFYQDWIFTFILRQPD